jgi:hypothetical protein
MKLVHVTFMIHYLHYINFLVSEQKDIKVTTFFEFIIVSRDNSNDQHYEYKNIEKHSLYSFISYLHTRINQNDCPCHVVLFGLSE